MTTFKFFGHEFTIYPGHQHPDGGVLQAHPGDTLPFDPGDGQWHEVDEHGELVTAAPPAEAPAEEAAPEAGPEAPEAGAAP